MMNFGKGVNTKYINNLILTVSNSIDFIMLKNNEIILTLNKKEQAINRKECVNVFYGKVDLNFSVQGV